SDHNSDSSSSSSCSLSWSSVHAGGFIDRRAWPVRHQSGRRCALFSVHLRIGWMRKITDADRPRTEQDVTHRTVFSPQLLTYPLNLIRYAIHKDLPLPTLSQNVRLGTFGIRRPQRINAKATMPVGADEYPTTLITPSSMGL